MAVYDKNQGKIAITHYKVLKRYNGYCLVEFNLKTGRTHQIRVHSEHLHHSIVGDETYGGKSHLFGGGQLLFAYKLSLFKPFTNERVTYQIDLPQYFLNVIKNLKEF